jgi:hypothetical protein
MADPVTTTIIKLIKLPGNIVGSFEKDGKESGDGYTPPVRPW